MKKQSVSKSNLPALRRLSAGAMLCCALGAVPTAGLLWPALAHAAADDAALNFVGAERAAQHRTRAQAAQRGKIGFAHGLFFHCLNFVSSVVTTVETNIETLVACAAGGSWPITRCALIRPTETTSNGPPTR